MKLSKKSLAALAVSSMIAMGAVSVPVFAAEDSPAYRVDEKSIKFYEDMSVTWTEVALDGSGKTWDEKGTAKVLKQTDADCVTPAYLWTTIEIDGSTYNSGNTDDVNSAFRIADPLGHDMVEVDRKTIVYPSHVLTGVAHAWYECTRCDEEYDIDVDLDAQAHVFLEKLVADANRNTKLDEAGVPQLIDITKDGYYDVVRYCECGEGEGVETVVDTVEILAKKAAYAVITKQEGIADQLVNMRFDSPTEQLPLNNNSIELENCTKDGYYIVSYFQSDDKPLSEEKIIVTAHHMPTAAEAEFKNADDYDQCVTADGKIVNKSCYLPVEYEEVIHCEAAGCPNDACKTADALVVGSHANLPVISKTAKVAEPAGKHVVPTEAKKAVAQAVENDATYEDLAAVVKNYAEYAKISADTSTCTDGCDVTVDYLCKVCKTTVETETVKVIEKGHIVMPPTRENYIAPSCTSTGSYDAVTYCGRTGCGAVLREVRNIIIPRIKHTNETSVDKNGIGVLDTADTLNADKIGFEFKGSVVVDPADGEYFYGTVKEETNYAGFLGSREYGVYVNVYSECENCDHKVLLAKDVKIALTDVKKQDKAGQNGSITLTASYTNGEKKTYTESKTFPYFSTIAAYMGRVDELEKEGLTKDKDGVYRYYVDGKVAEDYVGLVDYSGEKFLVINGELADEVNGLWQNTDGTWYFMSQGQIQRQHTGLALYDGQWFYIVNGKLDTNVNGLVPYNGGMFVFAAGRLCKEANGLWQDFDGTWYFLALGQVQTQHTGVAMYDNAFFYVKNGMLAVDYNGTITYDGAEFRVVAGQLY